MKMRKIHFSTWGRGVRDLEIASYAVAQDHETNIEAVTRSLERTTGLTVCGGPRDDGMALENGKPAALHYQLTLGQRVSGGYSPEAEVWVAIPVEVQP